MKRKIGLIFAATQPFCSNFGTKIGPIDAIDAALFLHREAGFFPGEETSIQMNEVLDALFFKDGEGVAAASAALTMDEVGALRVEFGDLIRKVLF